MPQAVDGRTVLSTSSLSVDGALAGHRPTMEQVKKQKHCTRQLAIQSTFAKCTRMVRDARTLRHAASCVHSALMRTSHANAQETFTASSLHATSTDPQPPRRSGMLRMLRRTRHALSFKLHHTRMHGCVKSAASSQRMRMHRTLRPVPVLTLARSFRSRVRSLTHWLRTPPRLLRFNRFNRTKLGQKGRAPNDRPKAKSKICHVRFVQLAVVIGFETPSSSSAF